MDIKKLLLLESVSAKKYHSIYSDTCGTSRTSAITHGGFSNNYESAMMNYLLNFHQEYHADFNMTIAEFGTSIGNIVSSTMTSYREEIDNTTIVLPAPNKITFTLDEAFFLRRSTSKYSTTPITQQQLSTFLYYSAGSMDSKTMSSHNNDASWEQDLRTYGSGGGLYPILIYLYIKNVTGIQEGGYIYQPVSHTLRKVAEKEDNIGNFIITPFHDPVNSPFNPAVIMFYTYNVEINYYKYGEFSLNLAFTEVGSILQNAHLTATAINLGFCGWGGMKKHNIEQYLKLDGVMQHVLMSSIMGVKK